MTEQKKTRNPYSSLILLPIIFALAARLAARKALWPLWEEDAWHRLNLLVQFRNRMTWPPGGDFGWPPGFSLVHIPLLPWADRPEVLSAAAILIGIAAVAIYGLFLARLIGHGPAFAGATLFALWPLFAEYTVQPMSEGLLVFCLFGSMIFLFEGVQNPARGLVIAGGILSGLAVFMRVESLAYLSLATIWLVLRRDRRLGWWLSTALPLPLFWLATNYLQTGYLLMAHAISIGQIDAAHTAPVGIRLLYWPQEISARLGLPLLAAGFGGLLLWLWPRNNTGRRGGRFLAFTAALFLIQLVWATATNRLVYQQPRYMIVPAAIILAGAMGLFSALFSRLPRPFRILAWTAAFFLILLFWYSDWVRLLGGQPSTGNYMGPENWFTDNLPGFH